jgi:GxxExxY protein
VELNQVTGAIIAAAMKVHTALGPGLLESAYRRCLQYELTKQGFKVDAEVCVPLCYDSLRIEDAYRADLIVEDSVVVELKSVEQILQIHEAQVISYLKLSGKPLGLLLNFNVLHMREGICRLINQRRDAAAGAKMKKNNASASPAPSCRN